MLVSFYKVIAFMRYRFIFLMISSFSCFGFIRGGQPSTFVSYTVGVNHDSIQPNSVVKKDVNEASAIVFKRKALNNFPVNDFMLKRVASRGQLGLSKKGRPVNAYYFPGTSEKKALVIAGVHGSELSAIEIAKKLVANLEQTPATYYHVVVIPCLFPDNELAALNPTASAKKIYNYGRYTSKVSVDPNRQMPPLGKPFDVDYPIDYHGRPIEDENQLLLQLIHEYQPDRVINLHAIRNINQAGIFADPRTDYQGFALGFDSDSLLAMSMAKFIYEHGGNVSGNHLDSDPTTLYYNDPTIAAEGSFQPRNLEGAKLPLERGQGISLGSWASTAVCDSLRPAYNRPAMRLLTVEYPGYKRPQDYTDLNERQYNKELLEIYTSAIFKYFFTAGLEEQKTDPCGCNNKSPKQEFLTGSK
jgi:hypothetical protein